MLISAANNDTDVPDHTGDTNYTNVPNRTSNTNDTSICFGIVGMQTDDTLSLSNNAFFQLEELELTKAGFNAKPKTRLSPTVPLIFNRCILTATTDGIIILY